MEVRPAILGLSRGFGWRRRKLSNYRFADRACKIKAFDPGFYLNDVLDKIVIGYLNSEIAAVLPETFANTKSFKTVDREHRLHFITYMLSWIS
jgi:hypothetical protein